MEKNVRKKQPKKGRTAITVVTLVAIILFSLAKILPYFFSSAAEEKPEQKQSIDIPINNNPNNQVTVNVSQPDLKNELSSTPVKSREQEPQIVQSGNISNGVNNGISIVGNNNEINVREVQRTLDGPGEQKLLAEIYNSIREQGITDSCVEITSINDSEALKYANEIKRYLIKAGLNVNPDIGISGAYYPPIIDYRVGQGRRRSPKKCVTIEVGYKP